MATYDAPELMTVAIARLIRDGELVFHGVNSIIPMVAINLAKRLHAPNATYVNIAGGIDAAPRFMPLSTTDSELTRGSASIFNNEDFYDLCTRGGIDTAFLGAVQIDPYGRTNVSVIGDHSHPKVRLPGGGGAAVIMPTARRVILWRTQHTRRVFVEKLDFVTAVGNVDRVVTPLCLFRRRDARLEVESIFPTSSAEEILAQTGFPLEIEHSVPVLPEPTDQELQLLQDIDPHNVRSAEFGAA